MAPVTTVGVMVCGPLTGPFVCPPVRLEAVQHLTVKSVSEHSVQVEWRGVGGARAYRLVWGPFTGECHPYRNPQVVLEGGLEKGPNPRCPPCCFLPPHLPPPSVFRSQSGEPGGAGGH